MKREARLGAIVVLLAASVALADDAIFDVSKTSLEKSAAAEAATKLVAWAQSQAKASPEFHIAGDYRALVRVAYELAPDTPEVVAAHARIKNSLSPEAPKKPVSKEEVVKSLVALGKKAKDGQTRDDKLAARYVFAAGLMLDPKDEACLVESEMLQKKGVELSWDRAIAAYRRTIPDGFSASINGLVVQTNGTAQTGQVARILLTYRNDRKEGIEVKFLRETGGTMVASMEEAVRYWDRLLRKSSLLPGGTIEISFEDKFTKKDGPSAGAAYTVLMRSFSDPFAVDPAYAMTGDVSVEGRVLQIGGVYAKIRGATLGKCTRVGVPVSNEGELTDAILVMGPDALAEIEVYSLETIADAIAQARADRDEKHVKASLDFALLRPLVEKRLKVPVKERTSPDPEIEKIVARIKELAPNHLSARLLGAWNAGQLPKTLSLSGSLDESQNVFFKYLVTISPPTGPTLAAISNETSPKTAQAMLRELRELKPRLHPDALKATAKLEEVCVAVVKFIEAGAEIGEKDKKVKALEKKIDDYKAKINRAKAENKSVDEQNRLVKSHNSAVEDLRKSIDGYNKTVEERNEGQKKIGTLYNDYATILRGMTQDPKLLEKIAHGK